MVIIVLFQCKPVDIALQYSRHLVTRQSLSETDARDLTVLR